ncbi:phosphonate metabolism protein PhnP [Enterobacteriaceae bacterium 4M9]|nr:phosphonate metabolism protein PhnP [Enterobacteriaceae bacterium 4M9]
MSLTLTFTGTGGAQQVPAFGCRCRACERAREDATRQRGPCSAVLACGGAVTLLDAGLPDLMARVTPGSFRQILLTHYHMDHVQGLFPLRWGVGETIPVYGPPDEQGCDDLFKHPGLLDFNHRLTPFTAFNLQQIRVTPLPLNHSKLTFGYLLDTAHSRLAWLCDTAGLPEPTLAFLSNHRPDVMVIDCAHAPRPHTPRNHSDLNTVIALNAQIRAPKVLLTHIGHEFDVWMMDNLLPQGFTAASDGQVIELP